jgi:hypothetical protein
MGLNYQRGPTGPNCYESPDVVVLEGARDIPYTGTLIAVLAPTDEDRDSEDCCQRVGLIFDDECTLIVDCLHSEEDVKAFRVTCGDNMIGQVIELTALVPRPCPPPTNQTQVADWSMKLFYELRPT